MVLFVTILMYNTAKPYKKVVAKINNLYDQGNFILIYTSDIWENLR